MILERLELFNFRNYPRLQVDFTTGRNLIIGRNAQGKTNLLEAVYFLSFFKSNRAARLSDLITRGQSQASLKGSVSGDETAVVRVGLAAGRRIVEVNSRRAEHVARARGLVKCVLFEPDDLYLVKGEPRRRRDFLDETAEALGSAKAAQVQEYKHAIRQRNALLRSWEDYGEGLSMALEPWDQAVARSGAKVLEERWKMVRRMGAIIGETYREISGGKEALAFTYQGTIKEAAGTGEVEQALRRELERKVEGEKKARTTLVGAHRDDVEVTLGGRPARYGASQGEQRTLVFAMRLAQKRYIEEATGRSPVLLLDDVLSELDERRRRMVMERAGAESQSLITATEMPHGEWGAARTFRVENGKVEVE